MALLNGRFPDKDMLGKTDVAAFMGVSWDTLTRRLRLKPPYHETKEDTMQQEYSNIYKTARVNACMSQESAAEVLGLSVESVKAYETGQRVPPDGTVARMARCYGSPGLRLEHGRETDELGLLPDGLAAQPLPLAALQLISRVMRFADEHRDRQLLQIAEDGVIDETEREGFDAITRELDGIVAAALALKCCESAKKERPELAGSKRSRSTGIVQIRESPYTAIIPQVRRNAREI